MGLQVNQKVVQWQEIMEEKNRDVMSKHKLHNFRGCERYRITIYIIK